MVSNELAIFEVWPKTAQERSRVGNIKRKAHNKVNKFSNIKNIRAHKNTFLCYKLNLKHSGRRPTG
jgi:hypothetical protein